MPMRAVARLVGEHDTRIWRVLHHYVDQARRARDDRKVRQVGIDETASPRRFHYVSLFVDLEQARVLYVAEGNKASTVQEFREDLEGHGGDPERVAEICCDMSPAFISGVEAAFPQAAVTFDKFHVLQLLAKAVDKTRKAKTARAFHLRLAFRDFYDQSPKAVQLGHSKPDTGHDRSSSLDAPTLERCPPLVRLPNLPPVTAQRP